MTEPHSHGPAGEYIPSGQAPEVEATEAAADAATEVAETTSKADVTIAKIQADRDRDLAATDLQREQIWQESRVAELEGRLRGMEEALQAMAPPAPVAEPVVVQPPPEAEPEVAPAPPPAEDKGAPVDEKPAKKKRGWFD